MSYTCVPEWQQPAAQDPFDYKLRPKTEILDEFKYWGADNSDFPIQVEYKKYTAGDSRAEDNLDNRERVAKIRVHLRDMNLAPLQRQRFVYLLGNRYTGSDKVKLVCRQYNTYHENYVRVMETLREIYWEAKRAPGDNTTAAKNPYRREFLKKKFFGRTREERLATLKALDESVAQQRLAVDQAKIGLQEEARAKQDSARKRRLEHAAKRLSLGFNDSKVAAAKEEGVQDAILEELEHKSKEYEKQIEEQKERRPVKMVSQVKGISKEEIESLMLRDQDKFKPI